MEAAPFTILAIDDDNTQLELLKVFTESIDFPKIKYLSAETGEKGLQLIRKRSVDLVLTDYRLPDLSGMEVLEQIKQENPLISVVVMTAFENARDAVHILKGGGDDYLVKPTKKQDIEHLVVRLFEQKSIIRENQRVDEEIREDFGNYPIIYKSPLMLSILNLVSRSAGSDTTVLVTGESGTGKELLAKLIHQAGKRKEKPFVTVNIAALPESLMESELFGYVKGAFTGADQDRKGRFEEADGGTIFIDEVGEIPPTIQVKLLRTLQFGQIQRVGENTTRDLDVRIITATNRDLKHMVNEGSFRSDLFWRINVIHINLPPLRERKEDIPLLVDHFIQKFNAKNERSIQGISREALDRIMRHTFPGNVRELENIIERSIIMTRSNIISLRDLTVLEDNEQAGCSEFSDHTPLPDRSYEEQMHSFEIELLSKALNHTEGNRSLAARNLGISERRFRSRLEILGMDKEDSKS